MEDGEWNREVSFGFPWAIWVLSQSKGNVLAIDVSLLEPSKRISGQYIRDIHAFLGGRVCKSRLYIEALIQYLACGNGQIPHCGGHFSQRIDALSQPFKDPPKKLMGLP